MRSSIRCICGDYLEGGHAVTQVSYLQFPERWVSLDHPDGLEWSVMHGYERVNASVHTSSCCYDIRMPGERDLFQFHWHPATPPIRQPHLHMRHAPGASRRFHIPTSRISIESVIRFAILELGARPIRQDWQAILDRNEQAFAERLTWSIRPPSGPAGPPPWSPKVVP